MNIVVRRDLRLTTGDSVRLPGIAKAIACPPAIFVDSSVATGSEILNVVMTEFVRVIKGVEKARTFEWCLLHAVDRLRGGDACGLIERGCNIVEVCELTPQASSLLDAGRPGDDQGIA